MTSQRLSPVGLSDDRPVICLPVLLLPHAAAPPSRMRVQICLVMNPTFLLRAPYPQNSHCMKRTFAVVLAHNNCLHCHGVPCGVSHAQLTKDEQQGKCSLCSIVTPRTAHMQAHTICCALPASGVTKRRQPTTSFGQELSRRHTCKTPVVMQGLLHIMSW